LHLAAFDVDHAIVLTGAREMPLEGIDITKLSNIQLQTSA